MKKLDNEQFEFLEDLIRDIIKTQNDVNDYFGTEKSRLDACDRQSDNWRKFYNLKEYNK